MKLIHKALILFISLFFCGTSFAVPFKQIIVLGDSLSDNGNVLRVYKIAPKSPPYYQGRFSNGPTWAEVVGKYYYDKYLVDTKNYAYGGGTAIVHNPLHDHFFSPMTFDGELLSYDIDSVFSDKSQVLYLIWMGANDYLYDTSEPGALTDSIVAKTSDVITALINQGGKNFVVLNLPDLARTPYAHQHQAVDSLHVLTVMHNQKLAVMLKTLKDKHPEAKFMLVDAYSQFNDLLANPSKYNMAYGKSIVNLTDPCWTGTVFGKATQQTSVSAELKKVLAGKWTTKNFDLNIGMNDLLQSPVLLSAYQVGQAQALGATRCADPDSHVFWDDLHPTQTVHEIFAKMVIQALVAVGEG